MFSLHHVRMHMYIAEAQRGEFKIVKDLGVIDPRECVQGTGEAS
jgi:branched-chain amino acid transport system substrate-binding protein